MEELTVLKGFVEHEAILFPRLLHLAPALSKVKIVYYSEFYDIFCLCFMFICMVYVLHMM